MQKISMKIIGMTWETEMNAEVEGDKISFNRTEFDQAMGIIARTHDEVSGGFQIIEETR